MLKVTNNKKFVEMQLLNLIKTLHKFAVERNHVIYIYRQLRNDKIEALQAVNMINELF
jgi:hypothetical protein